MSAIVEGGGPLGVAASGLGLAQIAAGRAAVAGSRACKTRATTQKSVMKHTLGKAQSQLGLLLSLFIIAGRGIYALVASYAVNLKHNFSFPFRSLIPAYYIRRIRLRRDN